MSRQPQSACARRATRYLLLLETDLRCKAAPVVSAHDETITKWESSALDETEGMRALGRDTHKLCAVAMRGAAGLATSSAANVN